MQQENNTNMQNQPTESPHSSLVDAESTSQLYRAPKLLKLQSADVAQTFCLVCGVCGGCASSVPCL